MTDYDFNSAGGGRMIRIGLDTVRKYRNKEEWRPVNRASAEGVESVGDGSNITAVAKLLIERGHDPETPCEVWRGQTLCFYAQPLGKWAARQVGKGKQPEHLKSRGNRTQ